MSLGSILLRLRQWSEYGLVAAYYRDIVRPRILRTPPLGGITDPAAEIHVLTSHRDWMNLIWTLKSFYLFSRRRYRLCIHDDGTLSEEGIAHLRRHFPDSRLILRVEADDRMENELRRYPLSLEFRRKNVLAPKVFDFVSYLQAERMLLLDSDLLFFAAPTELIRRIEDPSYHLNTVNPDIATAYALAPSALKTATRLPVVERFNSGLGLIHKDSMRLDWIEEFLGLPAFLEGHFWRIEQTIYALCSSRHGVELLPEEYSVYLAEGLDGRPSRHYVGAIRHLLYREGIAKLSKEGFVTSYESLATGPTPG